MIAASSIDELLILSIKKKALPPYENIWSYAEYFSCSESKISEKEIEVIRKFQMGNSNCQNSNFEITENNLRWFFLIEGKRKEERGNILLRCGIVEINDPYEPFEPYFLSWGHFFQSFFFTERLYFNKFIKIK